MLIHDLEETNLYKDESGNIWEILVIFDDNRDYPVTAYCFELEDISRGEDDNPAFRTYSLDGQHCLEAEVDDEIKDWKLVERV